MPILPGAAVGYLFAGLSLPAMTIGGLAAGVIVAVAAGLVSRFTALKEDASLAAFYLLSLALGVTIVSLRGSNVDLLHVLFGTVLALDDNTLLLLASISTITVMALAVLYRPLVLECVDPVFLRSVSRAGTPTHLAFLGLVVLNLVGGFHALGTLLAVGMMMLPAAAARFWASDITAMMIVSIVIGIVSGFGGLLLSFHLELPAGPAIILTAGIVYVDVARCGTGGRRAVAVLARQASRSLTIPKEAHADETSRSVDDRELASPGAATSLGAAAQTPAKIRARGDVLDPRRYRPQCGR